MEDLKPRELTPQEYFNTIKDKKHFISDDDLKLVYQNCLELVHKYQITNQSKALKKLMFHIQCIEKEREIIKKGINAFIYRDDIEYYIENVAKNTVKIIELENYEREIPDDISKIIYDVKDKFDQLYIVFTDYTGKIEREVQKERRDKDPILFGTFQDISSRTVVDRFYYLGDWVDEYCDLTLDKMINETAQVGKRNILKTISMPLDLDELQQQLNNITLNNNGFRIAEQKIDVDIISNASKSSILTKIKNFFARIL